MKSQVSVLLHVWRGVCKDVRSTYPALEGLDLDIQRLTLYCQTRGLALFTLDLPNLDALLLQGLETGRLQLSGPLSRRVSKRVRVPRLLSGLWLRVFDRNACLRQEVDANAIFFLRQLCRLGKNIVVDCSKERVRATTEEYHAIERQLWSPSRDWSSSYVDFYDGTARIALRDACHYLYPFSDEHPSEPSLFASVQEESGKGVEALLDKVQQVADLVIGNFTEYDPVFLSGNMESVGEGTGFKHGPGVVAERLEGWDKSSFPFWPRKLDSVFPFDYCGNTAGIDQEAPSRHEGPSVLRSVPKTAKSPRLIACEPVAHQYCQQQVLSYLKSQIESVFSRNKEGTYFIDLRRQHLSAHLVLKASLDRSLATVDLSSASDRLSCWTVERMLRMNPSLLTALHAARTRYLRDDVSEVKSFLKLRKFATQGTATTFPVQSLCFLFIALGASIQGRVTWAKIRKLRDQVRVYGDDIILPTHGYERLVTIMDALQLKVNLAKSYKDGQFRESCGTDGFQGNDVTPVSPKTLVAGGPTSCQAVVDTVNNLFVKGLWNASDSLRATIPVFVQRNLRIAATHDVGFAGLSSYSGSSELHLQRRWNRSLHRHEVRVWSLERPTRQRTLQRAKPLLDFFTSRHSLSNPRIVSTYGDAREARGGLRWVPLNYYSEEAERLRDPRLLRQLLS